MRHRKAKARRHFSTRRPNLARTSLGSEASIQTAAGSGAVQTQPAWFCRDWFWGLVLILSVILVYTPVWKAGFIWDDDNILTANPCIVGPLGLREIWTTSAADICPLTISTYWVAHALWGLNPVPYHLLNVFLHAACALLLWQVLRSLRVQGAWLGAALWALHPVVVESVAWVTEMKNTESGLFFLLSIFFFARWVRAENVAGRVGSGWNYALALLFAALAMASKSSTVILPMVLCLCAWWLDGRWRWRNVVTVLPMFLMAIAASALSIWTQSLLFAEGSDPKFVRAWPQRLTAAGDAVWFYLGKLLWPHPLITVYPHWQIAGGAWVSYLALLGTIIALSIFWLKRHAWSRACLFAFVYFLVALLPVLGLVENTIFRYSLVFDHLQYLASIAPLALAGAGLNLLSNSIVPKERWLPSSICAGLLVILGMTSWQRAWVYESPETLWTDTLAKNPDCWIGHNNLGNAFLQKGRLDEAFEHFQRAVELYPDYALARDNLGLTLLRKGQVDEAVLEYQKALEIEPNYLDAHNHLGNALVKKGKLDEAVLEYQKALEIKPNYPEAHSNLGVALFQKGQVDEAVEQFQKALEIKPKDAEVHNNLGNALLEKGRLDEAVAQYQNAVEINPNDAEGHLNLGNAFAKKGQLDEAAAQYQNAVEINPNDAEARCNLGNALFQKGQLDEALAQYQKAVGIDRNYVEARNGLGVALAQKGKLNEAISQFQEVLRVRPNFSPAQNNLARARALLQQDDGGE